MAWRTTRRFSATRRKILISTQAETVSVGGRRARRRRPSIDGDALRHRDYKLRRPGLRGARPRTMSGFVRLRPVQAAVNAANADRQKGEKIREAEQ